MILLRIILYLIPITQVLLIGTLGALSLYLVSRAIYWLTESWENVRRRNK